MVNIFVDPRTAFEDIAVAPRWLLPMLLIVVTTVGYLALFSSRVGWEQFIRRTAEANDRMQSMPSDQRERAIEMQVKFASVWGMIGPAVAVPMTMAITAGVLLFVFRMLLDANVRFPQVLGVTAWSSLPGVISTAAAVMVLLLKTSGDFDLRNPVGFNLGFYLPEGTRAWIVSLASSLDIFTLWTIVLLATGMAVVARRSWGSALGAILLPWALYVVVKVGWAALFG